MQRLRWVNHNFFIQKMYKSYAAVFCCAIYHLVTLRTSSYDIFKLVSTQFIYGFPPLHKEGCASSARGSRFRNFEGEKPPQPPTSPWWGGKIFERHRRYNLSSFAVLLFVNQKESTRNYRCGAFRTQPHLNAPQTKPAPIVRSLFYTCSWRYPI